mmetsp:Transcript_20044/g.43683  ORF Transcript_20044/g.43683 Transcript_20044/m.43683 type:complete len:414 (-) Transcript_20044:85-1326(-)
MANSPIEVTSPIPAPKKSQGTGLFDPRSLAVAFALFAALALACIWTGPSRPGCALPWALNPTGLVDTGTWCILFLIFTFVKDPLLSYVGCFGTFSRKVMRYDSTDLPSDGKGGSEGGVRRLERLEAVDLCYLGLNIVTEFVGTNYLMHFFFLGPMERSLQGLTVLNGPAAFILALTLNDVLYYPFHLVAHWRSLYAYCHKQHHRQSVPFRGYADASNEHPLEQIMGFFILISSLRVTAGILGIHAAAAWGAFVFWMFLNVANHIALDSTLHLPVPYPAFPRDHQMHHRLLRCNYGLLSSLSDRACGTFVPYRPLGERPTKLEPPLAGAPRPEFAPSPWSVLALLPALAIAATLVEALRHNPGDISSALATIPRAGDIASALARPGAAVLCLAAICQGVAWVRAPARTSADKVE